MFDSVGIFAREAFLLFLDLEIKRARRYQNFFSVMRFELCSEGKKPKSKGAKSLKSLLKLIREEMRETDVIGQTRDNEVMILLPYCDCAGANCVNMRLGDIIKDFHFGNREFTINSGLVCFPVEANDMAEIMNKLSQGPQTCPTAGLN